ncbi:hypothetical protein [Mariniplasma anaerobium]|uniref:Co-chaperone DjlA N-terminal domain-containing protein n=1 Tax=Mariniplasma anaerobium TaxID=2735436 RepID=A0A7U9TIQ5_9MOLU|nr:hypothetical protein [Mariniplasma anaerobium]BCR35375.1 hypothetical protein MPAN_002680 [Mariniplasma anaerobium]
MLLSLLTRKEKLKFLDLVMHMVAVDGEPTEIEQRLLNIMLAEVGDSIIKEYTFTLSENLEETVNYFREASQSVKNIVYLSLLKVTMMDDFYNTTEHIFLEEMRLEFSISDFKKKQLMRLVYNERDLRERAKRVVSN